MQVQKQIPCGNDRKKGKNKNKDKNNRGSFTSFRMTLFWGWREKCGSFGSPALQARSG